MIGQLLAAAALTLTYALTLASASPWDLAIGAVLALVLLRSFRGLLGAEKGRTRPPLVTRAIGLPILVVIVIRDVFVGAWEVVLVLLHLRQPQPALVSIPLGDRSHAGIATTTLIVALTPGTLLVDVDEERREMLVHAICAADPEALRRAHLGFYERYQKRVLP